MGRCFNVINSTGEILTGEQALELSPRVKPLVTGEEVEGVLSCFSPSDKALVQLETVLGSASRIELKNAGLEGFTLVEL